MIVSITVSDILNLPSLYGATVVAGHRGLNNIVDRVTCLEYGKLDKTFNDFFSNTTFQGNELVVSSFANIVDDIETQCENVRRQQKVGYVGLILFYVGIILPEINQRLIDVCNELGFPLIKTRPTLVNNKYSDVLSDIYFAIYRNQAKEKTFVSTLMSRFSSLPAEQKSLDALLRMLSNHLQASVILTSERGIITNTAYWPQAVEAMISSQIEKMIKQSAATGKTQFMFENNTICLQTAPSLLGGNGEYKVYTLKYGDEVSKESLWQASELIQLYSHIWNKNLGKYIPSELVRAIIEDEPLKMRRLSELYHIHVKDLCQMWLFIPCDSRPAPDSSFLAACEDYLSNISATALVGYYEKQLVAFTAAMQYADDMKTVAEELASSLGKKFDAYTLFYFGCLDTTASARKYYTLATSFWEMALKIYPQKKVLGISELLFAKSCCRISQDHDELQPYVSMLKQLENCAGLLPTLCSYLLDCDSNIQQTALKMCCHIIKYARDM